MKGCDLTLPTPEENLACDEVLLDICEAGRLEGVLRFWEPAQHFVVLGYANRAAREANLEFCRSAGIRVLRRCSGGGAVLQGPGCLNYSLRESAAAQTAAAAMQESDVGNFKAAHQLAAKSLQLARTRVVLAAAAIAYAQSGNVREAQSLANELSRRYPSHTFANLLWIPNIEAIIATQQGDNSRSIEILQKTALAELGNPNGEMDNGLELRPVYTRGQAYLALHRGTEAAAEFRKIIDHLQVVGGSASAGNTVVSLARLGLARAYSLSGDTVKARMAYQDFLGLWKGADPDIPILRKAKAEYAKLQ